MRLNFVYINFVLEFKEFFFNLQKSWACETIKFNSSTPARYFYKVFPSHLVYTQIHMKEMNILLSRKISINTEFVNHLNPNH